MEKRPVVARPVTAVAEPKEDKRGNYFTKEKELELYSSGCVLLDCVLGGGFPIGRMTNIVGDKSTGKTGMAIEACANFKRKYKKDSQIWYFEAESAFDKGYADILGLPTKDIIFVGDLLLDEDAAKKVLGKDSKVDNTVETLFEHLEYVISRHGKDYKNGLYVVDSLDALSDRAEQERNIDQGSYGTKKAAKMSEMFRRLVVKLEKARIHLLIISQVRDNIGVTFGAKHTRSGGKALDFYASQVLWLAELKKLKKTVNKVERVVGIQVKAQCKKNKIGMPYRDCEYPIMFGYGIDDIKAHLEWLEERDALHLLGDEGTKASTIFNRAMKMEPQELQVFRKTIAEAVVEEWGTIEESFLPERAKYE